MECANQLECELGIGKISNRLFKGSKEKELITDLQRILFELGFRVELRWDNYQADGDYGAATSKAVAAFALKNNVQTDGTKVTKQLASLMLQRHEFLPVLYTLWEIHQSDMRTRIYISKLSRNGITAIQVLLDTLGYSQLLKFAKYGADGIYGTNTKKAFIAYAKKNGIQSDGDLLSRPVVNLLLKDANRFYGRHWQKLAPNNLPQDNSPLVIFEASNFAGNPCRADVKFVPTLNKINQYAKDADVQIIVTSSFRTSTNVAGAIVKPATYSNHLAGHGIDMNLAYGDNGKADSRVMAKYPSVSAPVKKFLKMIIDDPKLRWGGQFTTADPVHIDDGLNRNMPAWRKRFNIMQKAVQLGE